MNSPTPTTTTYQSAPGGGPADPSVRRFVFLFLTGLVIVVIALFGRQEMSRWYQAKANNAMEEGRYDDAVAAANLALEWNPENTEVVRLRLLARQRNNDDDGIIEDFDKLLAEASEDGEKNERDMVLLQQKAAVLHRMKRYTDVLKIWDEIIAYRQEEFRQRDDYDSRYDYAMALNNRAYMLAQAYSATKDRELYDIEQGLEQSRLSLEVRQVDDDSMILDTVGYLLMFNGETDEAVKTLEKALAITKVEHDAIRRKFQKMMPAVQDQRPIQDKLSQLDKDYSIILHHRGEAYRANGEEELAAADIEAALQLGYNPEEGIW